VMRSPLFRCTMSASTTTCVGKL